MKEVYRDRELDDLGVGSRSSRHRWKQLGLFPRPIALGPRARGYLKLEIDEWIQERRRARDRNSKAA
jgi:predicted DNA-binding transcriptional regulator AlpA